MVENIDLKNLCEELLRILPSGSLQDVMNISYKYVKVPVLVVDILYNVLGIAPEVKTGDYYWGLPSGTQRL